MIPLNDNKKQISKIQDTIIREDDLKTPKRISNISCNPNIHVFTTVALLTSNHWFSMTTIYLFFSIKLSTFIELCLHAKQFHFSYLN